MATLTQSSTAPAETKAVEEKPIDWRAWLAKKVGPNPNTEYGVVNPVVLPYQRNRMCTNCGSHIEYPEGVVAPKTIWGDEYFKDNKGIFVGMNMSAEHLLERRLKKSPKAPLTDSFELKEDEVTISFAWRNA